MLLSNEHHDRLRIRLSAANGLVQVRANLLPAAEANPSRMVRELATLGVIDGTAFLISMHDESIAVRRGRILTIEDGTLSGPGST